MKSQLLQLQFAKMEQENQNSFQQSSYRKNLESALESIQSACAGLKLAILSSEEASNNYRVATIDFLQYLLVQQSRAQAELALNLYKSNWVVAVTNYFAVSGQDMNYLVSLLEPKENH